MPESTLCRIIQSKDKIQSQCYEGQGKLKRVRLSGYPKLVFSKQGSSNFVTKHSGKWIDD